MKFPVHPNFVFAGVRLDADSVEVMVLTGIDVLTIEAEYEIDPNPYRVDRLRGYTSTVEHSGFTAVTAATYQEAFDILAGRGYVDTTPAGELDTVRELEAGDS